MRALAALTFAIAAVLAPLAAQAGVVVSSAPEKVAVVIYRDRPTPTYRIIHAEPDTSNGGLALITETRTLDLPAGQSTIRFEGVSDQIVPQTAAVDGLPAKVSERNFDYDLLTPGSLVAKSLGQTVQLIDNDSKTGRAIVRKALLRSGPDGVVMEVDGQVRAFNCDSLPQQLVFERIPDGLSDKPTLSLKVETPAAGRYTVRLSYLATGFNWSADYVAHVRPDGKSMDIEGWITLANQTGETFKDAPTQVVAGRLALTGDDAAVETEPLVLNDNCWERLPLWYTPKRRVRGVVASSSMSPVQTVSQAEMRLGRDDTVKEVVVTGSRIASQENLGDYKLYTLPEPTTVAARQSKQVLFLVKENVPFHRVYRYVADWDPEGRVSPEIVLKFDNTKKGGLGLALPAGWISVREPTADPSGLFTGEGRIGDTPEGLPVKLVIGRTPNVAVTSRLVSETPLSLRKRRVRRSFETVVDNPLDTPATVEIQLPTGVPRFRLASESSSHSMDSGRMVWTLTLPPASRQVLTFSYDRDD